MKKDEASARRKNLLFVFSDQHRLMDLGCTGNRQVQTPNLDRLAAEGMLCTGCLSASPLCVPARGSLLTGLTAQKHGAFTNDMAIDPRCESVADVLRRGGWHTGYIGKWHLCGVPREQAVDSARRLGFEEWKVANCNHDYLSVWYDDEQNVRHPVPGGYEPEVFGSLAEEFVRRGAGQNGWALYLSFAAPHDPHMVLPDRALDPYRTLRADLRPNVREPILRSLTNTLTAEELRGDLRGYYGHITAIDAQLGRLRAALEQTGQLENTVIVYTSDHGDMLGSQGLVDKQVPYEEAVRVPLIVRAPGLVPHGENDGLLDTPDLPVSVQALLGLRFSHPVDGADRSALFTVPGAPGADACYLYDLYPCHQAWAKGQKAWRALRDRRYTYAVTAAGEWLFFDNLADPYQMKNLIGSAEPEHRAAGERLRAQLLARIAADAAPVDGDAYVRSTGRLAEFNASQRCFGFPELKETDDE